MNSIRPFPCFGHGFLLVVVFIVAQLAMAMPIGVLDVLAKTRLVHHGLALVGINTLAFFGVLVVARQLYKQPLNEHLARGQWLWSATVPVVVMFTGVHLLGSELDNLVRFILPMPKYFADSMKQMLHPEGGVNVAGTFLGLVVVAPVTEELLFRGVLLRGFLQRYGLPKAMVFSSVLFGLAHMNPWQFLYCTVFGLLLALVWWRTRSLSICILAHAINNLLAFQGATWIPDIPGYSLAGFDEPVQFQPWWLDLSGLVLTVSGIFWLTRSCGKVTAEEGLLAIEPDPAPIMVPGIPSVLSAVLPPPLPPDEKGVNQLQ